METKLVTRLYTGLSHLCEHKSKYSFQDSLNSICRCDTDVESCMHFFLHCPLFQNQRWILLHTVPNVESKLFDYSDLHLTKILLFGMLCWMLILNQTFLTQPSTWCLYNCMWKLLNKQTKKIFIVQSNFKTFLYNEY